MRECSVVNCSFGATTFPLRLKIQEGEFNYIFVDIDVCPEHSDRIASSFKENFGRLRELADSITIE